MSSGLEPLNIKKYGFIPVVPIVLVLGIYISNVWLKFVSDTPAAWGQFGDYFGGMLNPLLSTVTIFALIYTINIQINQLKTSAEALSISQAELELTRIELSKSAQAQHETQLALNKQALIATKASDLSTINFLIQRYDQELSSLSPYSTAHMPRSQALTRKKVMLNNIIEDAYLDLIDRHKR